ncbi:MAG: carboxypeptidase-like regulatory domain-containing protein [Bacteroidales bacterium]
MKKTIGFPGYLHQKYPVCTGPQALLASLVLFLWLAPSVIYAAGAGSVTDEVLTGVMPIQQKITVSGTVLSESDGLPLPGASVVEKGTLNATTTDQAGRFSILVAGENSVVVVSFMGMKPYEVAVSGMPSPLVISLQEDNFNLRR